MKTGFSVLLAMAGLLLCPAIAHSQNASDRMKPQWMHRLPRPTNSTFIYKTVTSSAYTLEEARKQTVVDLMEDAGMKSGVAIVSEYNSKENVSQVWQNGKLQETITNSSENVTKAKSSEITLHASLIDEYWSRDVAGQYHVHRLFAKSELGRMPLYDDVSLTTRYASSPAVWGLSLVPGAAQMYKGSYLKGGLIMGGSVVMAGGIITLESMRASYKAKINQTHSADTKKAYNNLAGNCATARNICLGGLAALYVYNLVDAYVAPGARRVVVTPSATPEGQYGMAVTYRF